MAYNLNSEEMIALSAREVCILLALAKSQMSGYGIARQCEEDNPTDMRVSNGTLYPALKRLVSYRLVESVDSGTVRPGGGKARLYRVTRMGRVMLEWQLSVYRRMVRLGESRQ